MAAQTASCQVLWHGRFKTPLGVTGRADPADLQRDRRAVHHSDHQPVTGIRYRLRRPLDAALNPATTDGKPGNRERNDLRLEYHVPHVRE
jgi:hypothetical protein